MRRIGPDNWFSKIKKVVFENSKSRIFDKIRNFPGKIYLHINPKSKAGKLIKDLLSILANQPGVTFGDEGKNPYDPGFVKMVQKAKAGKKRYAVDDVDAEPFDDR